MSDIEKGLDRRALITRAAVAAGAVGRSSWGARRLAPGR